MIITLHAPGAVNVWSNMPLALTEFDGGTYLRTKTDLSSFTTARLIGVVDTAGTAASELRVQHSLIGDFSDPAYLDAAAGPAIVLTSTGLKQGVAVDLAAAAKATTTLRLVGVGGNGANDPAFGWIGLELT